MLKKLLTTLIMIVVLSGFGKLFWDWVICYEWCEIGESLIVYRKTGEAVGKDQYADRGRKSQGVLEQMCGPGRHFFNPWNFSTTRVKDIVVPPGYIFLLKNNLGNELPEGKFLADPNEKGLQKRVITPGAWRINTYGQTVVTLDKNGDVVEAVDKNGNIRYPATPATIISPGYVGVQTVQQGEKKGVLKIVLQPAYFNINPKEISVIQFEVGYVAWERETVLETGVAEVNNPDGSKSNVTVARIKEGTGVSFPLADGKLMYLDLTVVYGIWPEDAPYVVENYGTTWEMVEDKIIEPQVLSICKNAGSNLTTRQFIEGATREAFQDELTKELQRVGKEKKIHFLVALVRGFHPSEDIKVAIQAKRLAEEERKTLKIEQERDIIAANLEQARRAVDIAKSDYDAETTALVQKELETGRKRAAEIGAEADRQVAELNKQTAELRAEIVKIQGQAEANVIQAKKKAEATKLELLIKAYGGPESYNLATFAELLPEDMKIQYRYAGQGTFWTDITPTPTSTASEKKVAHELEELAAKKILSSPPSQP